MTTKPRTCCTTHADNCKFGRDHSFSGPFLLNEGYMVDGKQWSHEDDMKCTTCGGICYGDRPAEDIPAEHVGTWHH